jgi:hypothetical protein
MLMRMLYMYHIMYHDVWRFYVTFLRNYKLLKQLQVKKTVKKINKLSR